MGTRNLICVQHNGEYKVAQYSQWDGYPEGQGVGVLNFLKSVNLDDFKNKLAKVRFIDYEGTDKEMIESYNKNAAEWSNQPDNRTEEQKYWFKRYISRDIGSTILRNIHESKDDEIILKNGINFAADSLFCEWAYVIDLDKGTFEVYSGFHKEKASDEDRFYFLNDQCEGEYSIVKLAKSFDINDLPEEKEFVEYFEEEECED